MNHVNYMCTIRYWVSSGRQDPHPSYQAHPQSTSVHYCPVGNQASQGSSSNISRVQKSGVFSDIYRFISTLPAPNQNIVFLGTSPTLMFLSFLSSCRVGVITRYHSGPQTGRGYGGRRGIQIHTPKKAQHT